MGVPDDDRHRLLGRARARPSGRRYHLALLARQPLELLFMDDASPLWHGLLAARVGAELTVLVAHLAWHDEDERLAEAGRILARFGPERIAAGEALLLGDLNALSRVDPYPPVLGGALAAKGIDKFGLPPRFEVTDRLAAAGWRDCFEARRAGAPWASASREGLPLRTDYVLASPSLRSRCVEASALERPGSDHLPVAASFGDARL